MSSTEINKATFSLPNWSFEKEGNRNVLKRTIIFSSFKEAFNFMKNVAEYAETVDHHPQWMNVYNRLEITLFTHTKNDVTRKDIDMANKMEEFLK